VVAASHSDMTVCDRSAGKSSDRTTIYAEKLCMTKPRINRREFVGTGTAVATAMTSHLVATSSFGMGESRQQVPRIALSYVNPYLKYTADGRVSAREFFDATVAELPWMQAGASRLLAGGVRLVVLSHGINAPNLFPGAAGVDLMLRCLDALDVAIEQHPRCALVRSKSDLGEAMREDKLAVVLQLTGAPINGSLQVLRTYARLGVRSIHPFIRNSPLGGDSSVPEATLTPAGRDAVKEMERCSILVDLAHANDRTFREVMRIAKRPVLDSHTACRALRDLPRNRTDDQLRAIASTGGVVGIHFASQLLADMTNDPAYPAWRKVIADVPATEARMLQRFPEPYAYMAHRYDALNWPVSTAGAIEDGVKVPRVPPSKLVDHIEHMVEVAGIDHVGIGSDYALSNICAGVETADKLPNLAAALRSRGYRQTELAKIMGGNLFRLFEETLPT